MTVSYKENEWRMADRLRLPASVIIAGVKFEVVDWSFSGFSIEQSAGGSTFEPGQNVELNFIIPLKHYAAQCTLQAEVRGGNDKTVGFEFGHLPEGVRLLMREYVEEFVGGRLEGRVQAFDENVKILAVDVDTPLAATHSAEPTNQGEFKQNLRHFSIYTLLLLLLIGLVFWSQRYAISTQAGLVGNTAEIRTRVDGFINQIAVKPGDQVEAGQLLIQLDEREARRNLNAAAFMQQRLESAVATAEKALAAEQRNDKFYARMAGGRLKVEEAKLSESEVLLKQIESDLHRAEALHRQGFISEANLADRKYLLQQRAAVLSRAKSETALAADVAHEAKDGRFFASQQVANRVNEMALTLENQRVQLAQATVALGPLVDSLAFTKVQAPQAGKMRVVTRAIGELVRVGDLLATIETAAEPYVLAKFSVSDAVRISPGQSVRVYFPTLDLIARGEVDSVAGQGQTGNFGLVNVGETNVDDVLVNIRLAPQSQAIPGGLRARVEIDTGMSFWIQLRQRLY